RVRLGAGVLRLGHATRPVIQSFSWAAVGLRGESGGAASSPPTFSQTRTVVPRPGSLSILSWPPWANTRCLTIASPRPVPPSSRDRALSTRENRSPILGGPTDGRP